jgi:glyoxylase-like metal-dependent hydrolase (beta-lactamase superfamily II)
MVDSGLNHQTCFDALCQQLANVDISLKDIRWLVITHFHPDHFGLAGWIKAASDAVIVMHHRDWNVAQFITKSARDWSPDELIGWATPLGVLPSELEGYLQVVNLGRTLFPADVEPDLLLEAEEEPLGDTGHLRAILTPGHTPGHVCIYDQRNKFLFAGDHVLLGITTHIAPSILSSDDQLSQYLEALQKVRRLEVEMVLPAHEKPFAHLSQRVDELLEHHGRRLRQVLAALGHHPLSARDIASRVEWTVGLWEQMEGMNRLLAIQETVAHLRLLQQRGYVTIVEGDELTLYKATLG